MLLKYILLGLIQGLTEFLPISSSGHLVMAKVLMGLEPDPLFDVLAHLGTLMAVLVVFRRDIRQIELQCLDWSADMFARKPLTPLPDGVRMVLLISVATVPTGLIGVLFKDWLESLFLRPSLIALTLACTGLILLITRWAPKPKNGLAQFTFGFALLIGLAQGVAIIPGISRSGSTIAVALLLGLDRDLSGRFSFLIAIPAILGAVLLEGSGLLTDLDPQRVSAIFLGVLASFASGLGALYLLMRAVRGGRLYLFAWYCLPVAAAYGIYCLITGV